MDTIAGGMLSVIPTGVFQPASILPTHEPPDFDMWHNMMREYSEEFLGNPEHDGDGDPIDWVHLFDMYEYLLIPS